MTQNNNYSEILRLRSQDFYSSLLKDDIDDRRRQQTTTPTTDPKARSGHYRDFAPIIRSNSSLSLDQKRKNSTKTLNNSQNFVDFKDFQELRECRFGTSVTSSSVTTRSTPSSAAKKSKTIHSLNSIQTLSQSSENLSKIHSKKSQKTKSLFFGNKNKSEDKTEEEEESDRRRRLRRLFVHYDIQSALSLDELFAEETTTTTTQTSDTTTTTAVVRQSSMSSESSSSEEEEENEFNSNLLLAFSENFRNEIGEEVIYCVQLNADNCSANQRPPRSLRRPKHCPALGRQLSCVSSFDMSSDVVQQSLLSSKFCPFDANYDFRSALHGLEVDFGTNYYRKYFYGFSHKNFFFTHNKLSMALSLRKDSKDLKKLRLILRTNKSLKTLKGFLNLNEISLEWNLKSVFSLLFPVKAREDLTSGLRLGLDSKSDELLLKFDELLENTCFKIGVLYAREFQSTEEDFYNNKDISDEDFDRFLRLIGTKVRLKGYKGFRGGLDVTTDTTGLFAFSTRFRDRDIVYHVMNELPFSPNNRQQLLRKRHIGNDIITIVFQNKGFKGKPFNPKSIRSHFQHVFIVVRPHRDGYRVAVARHKDVPPFGPPLKGFYSKEEFREFLLSKAINAETACHKCAKFKQMALRTRFEYLNDLYENYCSPQTVSSLLSSGQSSLSSMSSSVSSTQQLIQFSQNFNKYFSQIFSKNSSQKSSKSETKSVTNSVENCSELKTIFTENELFFGAKLYESSAETTEDDNRRQPDVKCRLHCHSFQEMKDFKRIKVLLNQNFLIVLKKKKTIFVLNLKQIIGFLLQNVDKEVENQRQIELQFKIFFHQGELFLLKELLALPTPVLDINQMNAIIEKNSILFELKSDLISKIALSPAPFQDHALRHRQMRQLVLQRALFGDKSFGFHIQCQKNSLFVTEVNEHALKVNQLRRGQRLLELCHLATISLQYQEVLDFLKTSQTVSVSVVQPLSDGKPRNDECFQRNCSQNTNNISHNFYDSFVQNNDYENIQTVTSPTTVTTQIRDLSSVSSPQKPSFRPPTTTGQSPTSGQVVSALPVSSNSSNQRPLHLKTALNALNQNHSSSQSSTTSSTLQEDLIRLLTINDDTDDTPMTQTTTTTTTESNSFQTTDSHSSSRYSTAASTPYSSLERRQRRPQPQGSDERRRREVPSDDCVVTVAKPAFVVNSVNELGFGRQVTSVDDAMDDDIDIDDELQCWPSSVASVSSMTSRSGSESTDSQLKEQVKELSQEKQRLNETIRQLKEENQRLHFESQTASQQLRKFTEWFFSSNQNQNQNK